MRRKIALIILGLGAMLSSCNSVNDKVSEAAAEAIVESLSGDSVKIDLHGEEGEFSVEVTNEEGESTSWDLNTEAKDLPDDFPPQAYILENGTRGMLSVVDSPDGKYVVIQDTLYMSLSEARTIMREKMANVKMEAEIISSPMSSFSFILEGNKIFTVSLNEGDQDEGFIIAQYGVMY